MWPGRQITQSCKPNCYRWGWQSPACYNDSSTRAAAVVKAIILAITTVTTTASCQGREHTLVYH